MTDRPKFGTFTKYAPRTQWIVETKKGAWDEDMKLLASFSFTSKYIHPDKKNKKPWIAKKGTIINGASIPWWAMSVLKRSPYVGDFRRGSVVHDAYVRAAKLKYCKSNREKSDWKTLQKERRKADWMLVWACLAGGCTIRMTATIYLAIAYRTATKKQSEQNKDCDSKRPWEKSRKNPWASRKRPKEDVAEAEIQELVKKYSVEVEEKLLVAAARAIIKAIDKLVY